LLPGQLIGGPSALSGFSPTEILKSVYQMMGTEIPGENIIKEAAFFPIHTPSEKNIPG